MQNHSDHFAFRLPSFKWDPCPSSGLHASFFLVNKSMYFKLFIRSKNGNKDKERQRFWFGFSWVWGFWLRSAFSQESCGVLVEHAILHGGVRRKNIAILFQCCGSGILVRSRIRIFLPSRIRIFLPSRIQGLKDPGSDPHGRIKVS